VQQLQPSYQPQLQQQPQQPQLHLLQGGGASAAAAAAAAAVQLPARSGPCFATPLWEAYRTQDALLSRTALGGSAADAAEGLWERFRDAGLSNTAAAAAAVAVLPSAATAAAADSGGRCGGGGRVGAAPAVPAASPAPLAAADWASGDRYLRDRLSNAALLARGLAAAAPLREAPRASHHRHAGASGPLSRLSVRQHSHTNASHASSRDRGHSSDGSDGSHDSDGNHGSDGSHASAPATDSESDGGSDAESSRRSGEGGSGSGSGGLSAVQAGRARWAVGRWGPTHQAAHHSSQAQPQQQQRQQPRPLAAPPQKPGGPSSSSSPAAPRVARFAEPHASSPSSAGGGAPQAGPAWGLHREAAAAIPPGGGVRAMASHFQGQR
jgi:hypothetical protein